MIGGPQLGKDKLKYFRKETGAAEPGVQGVQLHTHFLAPSFGEDHLIPAKFG